jgi:periodic tryptophan protein 1
MEKDGEHKSRMMITSLAWVKRGYAKAMTEEMIMEEEAKNTDMKESQMEAEGEDGEGEGEDKYNMKNYDEECNIPIFGEDINELMQEDNEADGEGDAEMDPEKFPFEVNDDEDEKEDYAIHKSDALIVTAAAEQDYSNLEVYLYEESTSNLFVHHEIMLNAYPLCLEWIPYVPGNNASFDVKGNYIAVGTFKPGIEIWNLDIIDAVAPLMTLGGETKAAANVPLASMKNKNKQKYFKEGSHFDSILCLSVHPDKPNFLASGSADNTIKIWDLTTQKCVRTIKNHKDKVQVLQWNPIDTNLLLSAGFDGKAVVCNSNNPNEKTYLNFNNTEIESGCWNPKDQYSCFFTFEDGSVKGFDTRNPDKPVFNFQAHEEQCTSIAFSKVVNMMVTVSTDETINVWDLNTVFDEKPFLVQSKNLKIGGLFT